MPDSCPWRAGTVYEFSDGVACLRCLAVPHTWLKMFANMRSGTSKPPSGPLASDEGRPQQSTSPAARGVHFWLAFIALAIAALLAAVETTIISSALPTIARDLGSGENYVWFVNAFMLTM